MIRSTDGMMQSAGLQGESREARSVVTMNHAVIHSLVAEHLADKFPVRYRDVVIDEMALTDIVEIIAERAMRHGHPGAPQDDDEREFFDACSEIFRQAARKAGREARPYFYRLHQICRECAVGYIGPPRRSPLRKVAGKLRRGRG
jgi:hypothetical protein